MEKMPIFYKLTKDHRDLLISQRASTICLPKMVSRTQNWVNNGGRPNGGECEFTLPIHANYIMKTAILLCKHGKIIKFISYRLFYRSIKLKFRQLVGLFWGFLLDQKRLHGAADDFSTLNWTSKNW